MNIILPAQRALRAALRAALKAAMPITLMVAAWAPFSAQAAPIWIERKFIAANELVAEVFTRRDETSDIIIDHASWGSFLSKYLSAREDGLNVVAYAAVTDTDKNQLNDYIAALSEVDVTTLNADEQLAFWINLYNAVTVRLIVEEQPKSSIRKLKKPWDTPRVTVNGVALTLNNIESGIIRPIFNDARIHYAVNCASVGCPNLVMVPYTGATLEAMLNASARAYVNHPRGVRVVGRGVTVSKIYGWYREDFGADEAAVLDHIRKHADQDLKESLEGKSSISNYEYSWKLNNRDAPSSLL